MDCFTFNFTLNFPSLNPLKPYNLQRRRTVSPLKIKITRKKISAGSVARRDLIPALKG
jgi:hypothetical protein